MDDNLEIMKKQRAILKGKITRLETFMKMFDPLVHSAKDITIRLRELEKNWDAYQEIQFKIQVLDSIEENDLEAEENKYFSIRASMENGIENLKYEERPARKSNIKLPTIDLPTFSGNYTEWVHFRDVFQSLIIENDFLSDIQRIHHLISSLAGDAKQLIVNIPPTSENFQVAWNLFYKRFNNSKLIVQEHVRALLNLPNCGKEAASSLSNIINKVRSNVNAISAIKEITTPVHELIISQLILRNIDSISRRAWELHSSNLQEYRLEDLLVFLDEKFHALESMKLCTMDSQVSSVNKGDPKMIVKERSHSTKQSRSSSFVFIQATQNCVVCKNKQHHLSKCSRYMEFSIVKRLATVKKDNLCFNCLNKSHHGKDCNVKQCCRSCGRRHHTTLHAEKKELYDNNSSSTSSSQSTNIAPRSGEITKHSEASYCSFKSQSTQVLLATSQVLVRDVKGRNHHCRVLLDSASQSNFITESLVNRLKIKKHDSHIPIVGIGDQQAESRHCVSVTLSSRCDPYTRTISCTVLRKITNELPTSYINISTWTILNDVTLADPSFNEPGDIDLLLGAGVFFEILNPTPQIHKPGLPNLIDTKLGWILSGQLQGTGKPKLKIPKQTYLSRSDSLHEQLQQFWNVEEISDKVLTKSEQLAEKHFCQNFTRDTTGRYQVRLPLNEDPSVLGTSYDGAFKRLLSLEKRFIHNPKLKQDYVRFLDEYESLGHMRAVSQSDLSNSNKKYYMSHHPVVKQDSSTTKTRVVFDASFKSTSGLSLNDILLVGPTIQEDLCSIVMRFRTHKVCFTADIEKMYRQIKVEENDSALQRIIWRRNEDEGVQEYELRTVTYGTSAAPFLAVRCLYQLVEDEGKYYPKAVRVLSEDMYVDDCISGAKDIKSALTIQRQLIELLSRGGFHLRKWASNQSELLQSVPQDDREHQFPLNLDNGSHIKTLGLLWHPTSDNLHIAYDCIPTKYPLTKRSVLSTIASIFDPLGIISPVVILCKIYMQKLWQSQLNWNDELPLGLQQQWDKIYVQLKFIRRLTIPRYVLISGQCTSIQLHGFSDASEEAYGACVYLRSMNLDGSIKVCLLCSKSRVAPLKRISVPRLELCGAVLLARLVNKAMKSIKLAIEEVHLWTDSTIVLSWLAASPSRWKKFVANRITEIHGLTEGAKWQQISTCDNPAHLISRGANPRLLKGNTLWWNGPRFLSQTIITPPFSSDVLAEYTNHEVLKEESVRVTLVSTQPVEWNFLTNVSRWTRKSSNIKPRSFVLLKENTPPLQWRTALVEKVHPGEDGLVRVVTIRTPNGTTKRPITKLCPFPE